MANPFDPNCQRFAAEMTDYDIWLEGKPTKAKRIAYVLDEEGTYNRITDHFYCDDCYIKLGQPLGVAP